MTLLGDFVGIEPEVVAAADTMEVVRGTTMPVAATGHRIALKLLSTSWERPNDVSDLRSLAEIATPMTGMSPRPRSN